MKHFCWVLLLAGGYGVLSGQGLTWQYQNMLSDLPGGGRFPEVVADATGNLHLTYWDQQEDVLIYGWQEMGSVSWDWSAVAPGGYRSSLAIDAAGRPHIAFLQSDGMGTTQLAYAHFLDGAWALSSVPLESPLGLYGRDGGYPFHLQASLDLDFREDGLPMIAVFDGTASGTRNCSVSLIYDSYELDLRLLYQDARGAWAEASLPDVPHTTHPDCLPEGDRFGEFCRILRPEGGGYLLLTQALHNHQLLAFRAAAMEGPWSVSILDTLARFADISYTRPTNNQFREGFEYLDAYVSDSGLLHMVYGLSDLYGESAPTFYLNASQPRRRTFWYARFHLDSLDAPGYSPMYREMVSRQDPANPASHDGDYRSFFSITGVGPKGVALSHVNATAGAWVVHRTEDGISWEIDTLARLNTDASTHLVQVAGQLKAFAYDSQNQRLMQATRPASGEGGWDLRAVVPRTRYGSHVAAGVRAGEADTLCVVLDESVSRALIWGERLQGPWTYSTIDTLDQALVALHWVDGPGGKPFLAFTTQAPGPIQYLQREAAGWGRPQALPGGARAGAFALAASEDSLYFFYPDLGEEAMHLVALAPEASGGVPRLSYVEALPGFFPQVAVDAQGGLHLGYVDPVKQQIRYAFRPWGGDWQQDTLTASGQFFPDAWTMAVTGEGKVYAGFRHAFLNELWVAEQKEGGWDLLALPMVPANFVGKPMKMVLDVDEQPWLVYNQGLSINGLGLVRRRGPGRWEPVALPNNQGQIANVFDLVRSDKAWYLAGRKQLAGQEGIALLWAEDARLSTSSAEAFLPVRWRLGPNPARGTAFLHATLDQPGQLRVAWRDLTGRKVPGPMASWWLPSGHYQLELPLAHLPEGLYICTIWLDQEPVWVEKVLILSP